MKGVDVDAVEEEEEAETTGPVADLIFVKVVDVGVA